MSPPIGFSPPEYGLIDDDPLLFRERYRAFLEAFAAQHGAGDAERVAAELQAALQSLDTVRQQAQEAEQLAQQRQEALEALSTQHGIAVAAYRQAALNGDPSLPPALVQGQTIGEVDAALEKARAVVEYVREKVLSAGGAGPPGQTTRAPDAPPRVPAGAPGRTLPDLSGMTAREKLVFGTSFR
ncbi:MAG TPA: hypothetical protein VKV26_06605 [Dehalococcoidia bacterium]|nr:hypothetical protein [Dehalococcoidia bacterium]